MSINLDDVDLSQIQTSFQLDVKGKAIQDCAWIEIINESDFTCTVNAGSINVQVLAWEAYPIELQVHTPPVWQSKGAAFPVTVSPRLLSNAVSQPYSTILTGVLYLTGEVPSSTSPRPLVRQAFIPNQVSTTVGNSLVLDTNTIQSPVSNATISLNATFIRLNPASAITGIIMTPGATIGDCRVVANISSVGSNTVTFAASGSNVGGGNGTSITPGHCIFLIWDGFSQWFPVKVG